MERTLESKSGWPHSSHLRIRAPVDSEHGTWTWRDRPRLNLTGLVGEEHSLKRPRTRAIVHQHYYCQRFARACLTAKYYGMLKVYSSSAKRLVPPPRKPALCYTVAPCYGLQLQTIEILNIHSRRLDWRPGRMLLPRLWAMARTIASSRSTTMSLLDCCAALGKVSQLPDPQLRPTQSAQCYQGPSPS